MVFLCKGIYTNIENDLSERDLADFGMCL